MFCPVLIITLSSLLSRNFLPQNPIHTWQKSKSPLLLTLQSISHCRPFNHTDLINKESQRALKYDLLCSSALFFLIIIFAFDLLLFLFFSFFSFGSLSTVLREYYVKRKWFILCEILQFVQLLSFVFHTRFGCLGGGSLGLGLGRFLSLFVFSDLSYFSWLFWLGFALNLVSFLLVVLVGAFYVSHDNIPLFIVRSCGMHRACSFLCFLLLLLSCVSCSIFFLFSCISFSSFRSSSTPRSPLLHHLCFPTPFLNSRTCIFFLSFSCDYCTFLLLMLLLFLCLAFCALFFPFCCLFPFSCFTLFDVDRLVSSLRHHLFSGALSVFA